MYERPASRHVGNFSRIADLAQKTDVFSRAGFQMAVLLACANDIERQFELIKCFYRYVNLFIGTKAGNKQVKFFGWLSSVSLHAHRGIYHDTVAMIILFDSPRDETRIGDKIIDALGC